MTLAAARWRPWLCWLAATLLLGLGLAYMLMGINRWLNVYTDKAWREVLIKKQLA